MHHESMNEMLATCLLNEMFAKHKSIRVVDIITAARMRRVRLEALAVAKKDLGLITSDYLRWVWSMQ